MKEDILSNGEGASLQSSLSQDSSASPSSSAPQLRILLIMEQCNPEWASVPLVGYNFFREIDQRATVTLVTHERNRQGLTKHGHTNVVYTSEGALTQAYYRLVGPVAMKIWALYHTLTYPVYMEFNRQVYARFKDEIQAGAFDLVHVITPMMPRYPVKTIESCTEVPFVLGPVNGGVPFPDGFREVAKKEFVQFNFLRAVGRWLLPGYKKTYQQADRILCGSTYTLNLVKDLFHLPESKVSLFFENGINADFLTPTLRSNHDVIRLLFVGRLVPYKGADMLLEALSLLPNALKERFHLTIVGDGSERASLEAQVEQLNLVDRVQFTGWVKQAETAKYYRQSDIFCFPSIREFGGAVVMEAMACGLPCIVVNNGGIGEYVTEETGFKIDPTSREYLVKELADKISLLASDTELRHRMSEQAVIQARQYEWSRKADMLLQLYQDLVQVPKGSTTIKS